MPIETNLTPDFFTKAIREGSERPGLLHDQYYEEMPTYEQAGCEIVYPDVNYLDKSSTSPERLNCQIVFGRDRDSNLLSGYGNVGGQPCASIDIVAGRLSSLNRKSGVFLKKLDPVKRTEIAQPNFFADASRIYISQKCKIDHYFGLPPGNFGRPEGEAGIGIKSDHVRVIGRESVKIYAGGARAENLGRRGELNSNGKKLTDARIEFITGTDKAPQPLVRGSNLTEFLEKLLDKVAELEEAQLKQNDIILKLHSGLITHFHQGGGVGAIVTVPDPILAVQLASRIPRLVQKIANNITRGLNCQVMKINYLGIPEGVEPENRLRTKKNILSRNVFTT